MKITRTSRKAMLVCLLLLNSLILQGCSQNSSSQKGDAPSASNQSSSETGTNYEAENETPLVITLNDIEIHMDEMLYYLTYYEMYGDYQANYNEYYYGLTGYWDEVDDTGSTMREQLKTTAYDTAIRYEILADKAVEAGKSLTKEEIADNLTQAENYLTKLTEEQLTRSGLTVNGVHKAYNKMSLAMKYSEQMKEDLQIDEATITASIKKEDYIEYETEYLYLPTVTYDAALKPIESSEEEIAKQLESMTAALNQANSGIEFSDIKIAMADTASLTNTTRNFILGSEAVEQVYQDEAIKLADGEISDIVKGEYGYYIIKMLNAASTASYDTAVNEAITKASTEILSNAYEEIKSSYTITRNDEYWDTLVMGEIALAPKKDATIKE